MTQLKINVVTDQSPDDIIMVEKQENELPDKLFVAYVEFLKTSNPGISISSTTYGAYVYNSEDDYKDGSPNRRPVDMVSTIRQNGITNKDPPMVLQFILKTPPG